MTTRVATALRAGVAAVSTTVVAGALLVAVPSAAQAHGSVSNPPSRVYTCAFLDPTNPMCAAAWQANPQACC